MSKRAADVKVIYESPGVLVTKISMPDGEELIGVVDRAYQWMHDYREWVSALPETGDSD